MPTLNERAHELADAMVADADALGIAVSTLDCGTRIIDCGVKAPGSIEAGRRLAELHGRTRRRLHSAQARLGRLQLQASTSKCPVAACMASQYAGWEIKGEKFFAMGSGPMRAAACREELFQTSAIARNQMFVSACWKRASCRRTAYASISPKCGVSPDRLTLLVASNREPRRYRSNRGPQRGNCTAQAARAWIRSESSSVRRGGRQAPCRRLRPMTSLPSAGRTTRSYTAASHARRNGDDESHRQKSVRRCQAVRRRITGGRSARSSRVTTTISTASIRCCSVRRASLCERRR